MAGRKAATKQVVEEEAERDFTLYRDKDATGTMQAFADWLIEVCELEFPNSKAEDQFRFGVQLGGTLRMEFQASDYWREDERNPRSPAGKQARAAANGAKTEKTTTRGRGKAQSKPEEEAEEEAPAKPATRRGRGASAKPAASKPATTRRRGAAKPASGEGTEAPY